MLRRSVERLQLPAAEEGRMVSVSVGLACGMAENEEEWSTLLGQADRALYQAKKKGRDRVEVFSKAGFEQDGTLVNC